MIITASNYQNSYENQTNISQEKNCQNKKFAVWLFCWFELKLIGFGDTTPPGVTVIFVTPDNAVNIGWSPYLRNMKYTSILLLSRVLVSPNHLLTENERSR